MTSLFELPEATVSRIAPDLMSCGVRSISTIEFLAIEDETRVDQISCGQHASDAEALANERAQQMRAMLGAAREEARAQAIQACEAEMETRLELERERTRRACAAFAQDRHRYFAAAEMQVVSLALAIARRVLAREVQADPMHLAAIVRAALARVRDGSECVVRVQGASLVAWTALFANPQPASVTVVADDRLDAEDCIVETEVGRVQLGVEAQMDEIERGFAELTRRQAL